MTLDLSYVPPVDRIIANTINETARGDPDALASGIVAALAEAGYSSSRRMEWRPARAGLSRLTS